ncbi:MAG: hypothetical protein OHK0048_18230 [Rhodoferax sp.]
MSTRRKLPIGIQTFREIRDKGHYHVDKTPLIPKLVEGGKYYFLSRPRRFGKSLLLDTIAEAFAGHRALFDGLRNLYSVLKSKDASLKFVMLVGVSKFSKLSIFSGLNNLSDITLDRRFATICGHTESDVDTVFAPELEGLDRNQIRHWYDG